MTDWRGRSFLGLDVIDDLLLFLLDFDFDSQEDYES